MRRSLLMTVALFGAAACSVVGCAPEAAKTGASAEVANATTSRFDDVMHDLASRVDSRLEAGIPVPFPVDAGGGYTHEQHKQNGKTIYEAGLLYEYTGDEKYLAAMREILLDYAELYPTLDIHPEQKSSNKGKLFWQGLNEAMWLVYSIQGYEKIRDDLDEETRKIIEDGVYNPIADFLSVGSPQTFDLIHNHATWATAGVGMTGYVLGQPERVEMALYGLDKTGEVGFLKQLDELFSPDGYYAEGPYYQRFAMMPFVLFAQVVEKNDPDKKIFEHRDQIILKAVRSTLDQSYAGKFFPINDAIREKGINTVELKYGLSIAYDLTKEPDLLGAAMLQNGVVPTPLGAQLLSDIDAGKAEPYEFKTQLFRDGPSGEDGGLAVLRSGPKGDDAAVLMKATTQGLGHGHFDKLGFVYYDNGDEIVADYGASRFLNVEPKFGGRYLPENDTWAKQSVAHNTLVVDEISHFDGDWRYAQQFAPEILTFDTINSVQLVLAEISTAYQDVTMQRLLALVPTDTGGNYIVDIMRGMGEGRHTYDLPVHFKGQLIETSFDMAHETTRLEPFGTKNGYQHLWKRSESEQLDELSYVTWLLEDQFYTLSFKANHNVRAFFTELGANDPNHNLRREQSFVLRAESPSVDFVSVYQRHGRYDSDNEVTVYNGSSVSKIDTSRYENKTVYSISTGASGVISIVLADDTQSERNHSIQLNNETISWSGPAYVQRSEEPL